MAKIDPEQLTNCALCPNMCRCDCPVLQVLGREAVAPAGKARLALLSRQGSIKMDHDIFKAIAHCLGCRGCTVLCPFDELNLCDELLFARNSARTTGFAVPEWDSYLGNLKKFGSPYGQEKSTVKNIYPGAGVLLFAGCTALANNPNSINSTVKLLELAGIKFQLIDEDCCGYPAETWGDLELAHQLAAENRRKIIDSGASILITNCPECWLTFTDRYPDWDLEMPLEIIDMPTFLLDLLQKDLIKPKSVGDLKVSYHDPCIWARSANKTTEPLEILKMIPDLVIEYPADKGRNTRCCGGGRMFQLSFPQAAAAIARRRLQDFSPAVTIITACPFCREGLLHDNGNPVFELVELLKKSCCQDED